MGGVVREISLSKGKVALVDDIDFEYLSQRKWCFERYAVSTSKKLDGGKRRRLYMHRLIIPTAKMVDHIDGNKLNNQRNNLRACTHTQNSQNSKIPKKNKVKSSQYKGVNWHDKSNKWRAYIVIDKKNIHIGTFSNEEDAATAYNLAATINFGDYARVNIASA